MLPNSEECTPGPAVCCDALFSVGEKILAHALEAVNNPACYLDECHNPNIEGIVTLGRASSYPQADLLTCSMQRLFVKPAQNRQGQIAAAPAFLSTWELELIESGWVTFEDAGNEQVGIPDPGYIQMLALYSYSHAEQMFRRVANAIAVGDLGCRGNGCGATIGDLVPVDPLGHLVGWRLSVTVPVDFTKDCTTP
jgi:hypothetical protein